VRDLLEVKHLHTNFYTYRGVVKALGGVDLKIGREEFFGLVGETGCGKSVTALSIMRLIEEPGRIESGEILFDERDLLKLTEEEMERVRGKDISMIFQEPKTALNPVLNVGFQIAEAISHAYNISLDEALDRVENVLREVEMADPTNVAKKYPHELSGGMAQRVLIGMAIATEPKLLIADEPTSSLDVSVQSQIMKLINTLIEKRRISVLLITHNLGVVAENCSRVGVMYAGNLVECADVKTIFSDPAHPYTKGLIDVIKMRGERGKLSTITGLVPDLVKPPSGCRFHPRCPHAMPICRERHPKSVTLSPGHSVSCFLYGEA